MIMKNQEMQFPELGYTVTYEQLNTLLTFMKLWSELTMWTRALMVSTISGTEDRTAIINQLFSVLTEIYSVMRVFYGPSISRQFLDLMTNFVVHEWTLFEALQSGNREQVDRSTVSLYQTADAAAALLSQINVYWYEDQWKSLLYQTIRLVIEEMMAMMAGEHEREIEIYQRLDDTTDLMGSYMARGIIARSMGTESVPPMQF